MLFFSPAWIEPTVTTATSRGSTSRETIVCRRITVAAAMTTGSIVECGREPCPPRPSSVTVRPSDAAIWVPERTPMVPAGSGVTCWPSTMSGLGKRSSTPSAIIACDPAPYSSAGWKTATIVPDHSSFVATRRSSAPSRQVTCMSWPHACMTGTSVPAGSVPRAVLAYSRPVRSSTGSASMSARSQTTGPSPLRIDADHAGLADALFELDAEVGRARA